MLIFGDNKKVCRELCGILQTAGHAAEVLELAGGGMEAAVAKAAQTLNNRQLILAFRNGELQDISALFHSKGIERLFVCAWDTHRLENDSNVFDGFVILVDNSKPRLDYLEIEVAEGCNLNCKGCNEFSNLADAKKFPDLAGVKRDLFRLKDLFWGIGKIRLMGGEPLINPGYVGFVRAAREVFPDSDLRLLSNGLLIPGLKKTDLEQLRVLNCSFDISSYPPTRKILGEIERTLKNAGISYHLSLPNRYFFRSLLREPHNAPEEAFSNCLFTHCHALSGGYLSACSNQMYAHRLNTAFHLNFPDNDKIDIYRTDLSGWAINEMFHQPHEFCRYCARGMVPYKWEAGSKNAAQAGDWLIEPNDFNLKIVPLIQKVFKAPAKQLRNILMRPKGKRER